MVTKEMLHAEISRLDDEQRERVYRLIRDVIELPTGLRGEGLMAQLREIRIDAPSDFAENFDLYASGEKAL